MEKGYKLDWKLKENIRLGKICNTCYYGSKTVYGEIPLCLYEMEHQGDIHHPDIAPSIKTCYNWKKGITNENKK